MKRKPHTDFPRTKETDHSFPGAWYGNCFCKRCGIDLVTYEQTQRPCVSDAAIALGHVVKRLRRAADR